MAVLLVALGVMAILWTAAVPVWSQLARREREEELIFRGSQYARAIGLFQRKYANANPPSLDVLIQQHFLRRRYRDPMVPGGEFQLLYQTPQQPGSPAGRQGAPAPPSPVFTSTQQTSGGIIGVASKSKEASLRVYNGRTHYNEWQFIYLATTQQPGAPAGGAGAGPGLGRGAAPGSGAPAGLAPPGGRGDGRGGPGGRGQQDPALPNRGGFPFPRPGAVTPPIQIPPQRP
jgi:type II secretory pathway pseudopilin PulG